MKLRSYLFDSATLVWSWFPSPLWVNLCLCLLRYRLSKARLLLCRNHVVRIVDCLREEHSYYTPALKQLQMLAHELEWQIDVQSNAYRKLSMASFYVIIK